MNDDSLQIAADIFGGNAQSLDSLLADPLVAMLVAVRVIAHVVGKTVDLYGYGRRFAEEVEHERP